MTRNQRRSRAHANRDCLRCPLLRQLADIMLPGIGVACKQFLFDLGWRIVRGHQVCSKHAAQKRPRWKPLPGSREVRTMIRTYTMRLKVTRRQDETLTRLLAQLCELYNMALEQRRNAYRELRVSVTYRNQQAQLTELRSGVEEYASFPVAIQRDPLQRVDRAFKAFFRRCKTGEYPGFPRFRSIERYDSFSVPKGRFRHSVAGVSLVSIGAFKVKTRCRIEGDPLELRIKRCGNKWQRSDDLRNRERPRKDSRAECRWYRSRAYHSGDTERWHGNSKPSVDQTGRGDTSQGECDLSRKVKGSGNRRKARERLRRVHQRIAGLRSTYLTKVAKDLLAFHDLVAQKS